VETGADVDSYESALNDGQRVRVSLQQIVSLATTQFNRVAFYSCHTYQHNTCKRSHIMAHLILSFTHTHNTQPFYGSVDFVRDNPGEPVPDETFIHSQLSRSSIIPICFLHLLRSMASSLFNSRALQSFSTISLQVFFGLPLGLAPSTSYSICFFTQSVSSFRSTCPYHRNLS